MQDSLCFTFSQNLVTKVAFLPLSENEISSETEILHGVDDLFYPQHLHHQQKCCFSRGLLGRAVGVSYAVWHGGRFMLPVADGQMPDQWPDTWSKEGPWPSAKLDWRLTRDREWDPRTHSRRRGQIARFRRPDSTTTHILATKYESARLAREYMSEMYYLDSLECTHWPLLRSNCLT